MNSSKIFFLLCLFLCERYWRVYDVHAMNVEGSNSSNSRHDGDLISPEKLLVTLKIYKQKLDELTLLLQQIQQTSLATPVGPKKFVIVSPSQQLPAPKTALTTPDTSVNADIEMMVTPGDPVSIGAAADKIFDEQIKYISNEDSGDAIDLMMIENSLETPEDSAADATMDLEEEEGEAQ